jgi:hypothetical protein
MKTKLILCLLLPTVAFAAPGRFGVSASSTNRGGPGAGLCVSDDCPLNAVTLTAPTTLAAADLVFGVEEERMSHDLYVAAFERWGVGAFDRISQAETRHEAAFVQLAASVNVALPPAVRGVYATAELQSMYQQLLALVNESAPAALRAGALVEETDIVELRRMIAVVQDDRTREVLAHLEAASGRHLRAFARNLERYGESYQPQVLSAADFAAVIALRR